MIRIRTGRVTAAFAVTLAVLIGQPLLFATPSLAANPGEPDAKFGGGGGGVVVTDIGEDAIFNALAVQADGKIVAVGSRDRGNKNRDFAVLRYNANGTVEKQFDPAGIGGNDAGDDVATSVAIQPDGKIVVAGYTDPDLGDDDVPPPPNHIGTSKHPERFVLVRYDSTGKKDASFGVGGGDGDGVVTTEISSEVPNSADVGVGHMTRAYGVAVHGPKIVAVGGTCSLYGSGSGGQYVYRIAIGYEDDGDVDASFGGGIVYSGGGQSRDCSDPSDDGNKAFLRAVAIGGNGTIVAAGSTLHESQLVVEEFSPTGVNSLRPVTFGAHAAANGVAVQPDGKVVAVGWTDIAGDKDVAMVRFDGGTMDPTFNGGKAAVIDGRVTHPKPGSDDVATAVVVHDEKIIVGGSSNGKFALARYKEDGSPDPDFGSGGEAVLPTGITMSEAKGVAVQSDCKIVAAGSAGSPPARNFAISRFLGDTPTVSGYVPGTDFGPSTGGSTAVLNGTCFEDGTTVEFGGSGGKTVHALPDRLTVTTPPHKPGKVKVTLTTPSGLKGAAPDDFTYHPTITGITPPTGRPEGDEPVTILGDGLAGAGGIKFGPNDGKSEGAATDREVKVRTPVGSPGEVVVALTVNGLPSLTPVDRPRANVFTYDKPIPVKPPDLPAPGGGLPGGTESGGQPALPNGPGQAVAPNADLGQAVAPNADLGQAVAPNADLSQAAAPSGNAGQAAAPSASPGQAVAPSANPGQAAAPSASPGQAAAPSANVSQAPAPSASPGAAAPSQGTAAAAAQGGSVAPVPAPAVAPPAATPNAGLSTMGAPPPNPSTLSPAAAPEDAAAGHRASPAAGSGGPQRGGGAEGASTSGGGEKPGGSRYAMVARTNDAAVAGMGAVGAGVALLFGYLIFFYPWAPGRNGCQVRWATADARGCRPRAGR